MGNKNVKKKVLTHDNSEMLLNNIRNSILEYINENTNNPNDTVAIGRCFSEWILYNVFELREDEVSEAIKIGGSFDNGLDAIFELNDTLYLTQFKYNSASSFDAIVRFKYDCERLLENPPITNRQEVKEECVKIRERFNDNKKICCCFITNKLFTEQEFKQISELESISRKVELQYWDLHKILENIEIKKGQLPKEFRGKTINIIVDKYFETDEATVVSKVSLKELAKFVNKGGNLLFHSNIRNYLSKTKINKGIEDTLTNNPEKFWYYNNGITLVCQDYTTNNYVITTVEPQIVNGCQTAKTIADYFKPLTSQETSMVGVAGSVLVKIIRTKKSETEEAKKELRDNITRYTNSQNAVKGLDFYSLDEFQRDLQKRFEEIGYYYEIQRGAHVALERSIKSKYKGTKEYDYLMSKNYKNILPAKEVIQAHTAGIKQLPSVAYGKADELTPIGSKWDDICNEKSKAMPIEHFLFPYLILKYIKTNLGYKAGANDHRKSSSLLFLTVYYRVICDILGNINSVIYENPDDIKETEQIRKIFGDKTINKELINLVHKILESYFSDSKIEDDYINDNINTFLKTLDKTKNEPWYILMKKIKKVLDNENKLIESIKELIEKQEQ